MATSSSSTRAGSGTSSGRSSSRENTAKAMVADQISQAVQSTSNLLHLMQQSSPSQANLIKLPKNLMAKASTIKNTGQVLEQMPRVISSFDAHMEDGLQSVSHLKTVIQLLANIESCQLNSLSQGHPPCRGASAGARDRITDNWSHFVNALEQQQTSRKVDQVII